MNWLVSPRDSMPQAGDNSAKCPGFDACPDFCFIRCASLVPCDGFCFILITEF